MVLVSLKDSKVLLATKSPIQEGRSLAVCSGQTLTVAEALVHSPSTNPKIK